MIRLLNKPTPKPDDWLRFPPNLEAPLTKNTDDSLLDRRIRLYVGRYREYDSSAAGIQYVYVNNPYQAAQFLSWKLQVHSNTSKESIDGLHLLETDYWEGRRNRRATPWHESTWHLGLLFTLDGEDHHVYARVESK